MRLPPRVNNLIKRRFGLLKVKQFAGIRNRHAYWLVECDCGAVKIVRGTHLTSANGKPGTTRSCSCLKRDVELQRAKRLLLPIETRKKIAQMGGKARWKKVE